jgi:M6 family metalloprotease-like protein
MERTNHLRAFMILATVMVAIFLAGGAALMAPLDPNGSVAQAQTEDPERARMETLSGTFHILWGDPHPDSGGNAKTETVLVDDQGRQTKLSLEEGQTKPLGGPLALNGKRVKVQGTRNTGINVPGTEQTDDRVRVVSIQFEQPEDAAKAAAGILEPAVSQSKPVVSILCRFADSPDVTPHEKPWFEPLMGTSEPGMDHYWRETSYDNINLTGSKVVGWYNLPEPHSYYIPSGQIDWSRLANDCTAAADADVFFPNYGNINLFFNENLDCCAYGGSHTLFRDGQTKTYGMTWMPPWGYQNQSVMEHEMGHSYGLPHSSGPYNATYDSSWDPMSNAWSGSYCTPADANYGCTGAHTISFHKNLLGWIPPERKYMATGGPNQNITIERLGEPNSNGDYLMAQIPIGNSPTQFYTVEARRFIGYDNKVPGEAVIIHKVDTTTSDRNARVVDSNNDNNNSPNDQSAMWLPGETFTDSASDISVAVTEQTASGYKISIDTASATAGTTYDSPIQQKKKKKKKKKRRHH